MKFLFVGIGEGEMFITGIRLFSMFLDIIAFFLIMWYNFYIVKNDSSDTPEKE